MWFQEANVLHPCRAPTRNMDRLPLTVGFVMRLHRGPGECGSRCEWCEVLRGEVQARMVNVHVPAREEGHHMRGGHSGFRAWKRGGSGDTTVGLCRSLQIRNGTLGIVHITCLSVRGQSGEGLGTHTFNFPTFLTT
jgi:hypothetical protein